MTNIIQKSKQLAVLACLLISLLSGLSLIAPAPARAVTPAGCGPTAGPPTPGVTCPVSSTCQLNQGTCPSCYKTQADCIDCTAGKCSDPAVTCSATRCDLINTYVNPAINLFSGLVGLVVTISLIYGGIQYASSAGDPNKASAAKGRITKTLIAFFIYAFFYGFLQFLIPGGIFK